VNGDLASKKFVYVFWAFVMVFLGVFVSLGVYYQYGLLKKGVFITDQVEGELGFKNMGATTIDGVDVSLKTFVGLMIDKGDHSFVVENINGNRVKVLVTERTIFMEPKFRKCELDVEGCQKLTRVENQTLKYEDLGVGDLLDVNLIVPGNRFQKDNYYEAGIILLSQKSE